MANPLFHGQIKLLEVELEKAERSLQFHLEIDDARSRYSLSTGRCSSEARREVDRIEREIAALVVRVMYKVF